MEPPPCIQNAMMTKDKKPFTYTPGGLNLSEIKSPRMARRLERNAAYEGVEPQYPQRNKTQISPTSPLAASIQPQLQVKVLPSIPPPPPPMHMPAAPPPPPPLPVPGQSSSLHSSPSLNSKVPTQESRKANQNMERPDMTKIIPENPMSMLKKTGGPRIKNTLLNEIYSEPLPQASVINTNQVQPEYSPIVKEQKSGLSRNISVESPPYQPEYKPQVQKEPQWSPPIIERIDTPVRNNPQSNSSVGFIYPTPSDTRKLRSASSIETPQSPEIQSPETPTLREAPKPWQNPKYYKQEEAPSWTRKETVIPVVQKKEIPCNDEIPNWPQNNHQFKPQQNSQQQQNFPKQQNFQPPQQNFQQPQQSFQQPQQSFQQPQKNFQQPQQHFQHPQHFQQPQNYHQQLDDKKPNAVYVTQPIVLQHPGNGFGCPIVNRREIVNDQDQKERFNVNMGNRQQNSPNNFSNQQNPYGGVPFPMTQSFDKDSDRVLVHRFKEDTDSERPLETQITDPRYRGASIPSKAFRMLQQMTDTSDNTTQLLGESKKSRPQGPQVRNIPIQIEGDVAPLTSSYTPASQQIQVEEPKKYTGSSIPSRSFRILQTMTADDCGPGHSDY